MQLRSITKKRKWRFSSPFVQAAVDAQLLGSFLSYLGDKDGLAVLCTNRDAFWQSGLLIPKKISIESFRIKRPLLLDPDKWIAMYNTKILPTYFLPRCLTRIRTNGRIISRLTSLPHLTTVVVDFTDEDGVISPFPSSSSLQHLTLMGHNRIIPSGVLPSCLISLEIGFNAPLAPNVLPDSLIKLKFSFYNHPFILGVLPPHLTSLECGNSFSQSFEPGILPSSLKKLDLGSDFNQKLIPGCFPSGLENLSLGRYFNQPIEIGVLPSSLHRLNLSSYFDRRLSPGVFPDSLKILFLGLAFNRPLVKSVFPPHLELLNLGGDFNCPLGEGIFPPSLRNVTFSRLFNQPINKDVFAPFSLHYLDLGVNFNQPLQEDSLPQGLVVLKLGQVYNHIVYRQHIPLSVNYLECNGKGYIVMPHHAFPIVYEPENRKDY